MSEGPTSEQAIVPQNPETGIVSSEFVQAATDLYAEQENNLTSKIENYRGYATGFFWSSTPGLIEAIGSKILGPVLPNGSLIPSIDTYLTYTTAATLTAAAVFELRARGLDTKLEELKNKFGILSKPKPDVSEQQK